MKKLFTSFILICLAITMFSLAPQKFNYQAVVRDSDGNPLSVKSVSFQISILSDSESGTAVYTEIQSATSNTNGVVTLQVGNGTTSDDFSAIDWSSANYYLKTEMDASGGTNYVLYSNTQLLSVPYALHATSARTAENVTTYKIGDYAQGGVVFWVDETGQHGLACAITDQDGGSGKQWENGSSTTTSAVGNGVYAGKMNTMLIIANQGATLTNYAAGLCVNYSVTQNSVTYGDWYLPSKYELYLMYANKTAINTTATANSGSGFASSYYWSSTESSNSNAWKQYFVNGNQGNISKISTNRVRAVRAF